jgi:hypothetical protein
MPPETIKLVTTQRGTMSIKDAEPVDHLAIAMRVFAERAERLKTSIEQLHAEAQLLAEGREMVLFKGHHEEHIVRTALQQTRHALSLINGRS